MKKNEYLTKDLFEASAIAITHKPIRLDENKNNKSELIFVFPIECEDTANSFWNGDLNGNLRDYANSVKSMKDWIFSMKRRSDK